jgi:signal transduction histidine kinase
MRDAGMPLELDVTGSTDDLEAGLALAAYRIVQEALTNTLRHAGPVATSVQVGSTDTEVEIRVRDQGADPVNPPHYPSAPAEGGHGLVGMRERAALFAGTVTADHHPDGGFEVHARLPRQPVGERGRTAPSGDL